MTSANQHLVLLLLNEAGYRDLYLMYTGELRKHGALYAVNTAALWYHINGYSVNACCRLIWKAFQPKTEMIQAMSTERTTAKDSSNLLV